MTDREIRLKSRQLLRKNRGKPILIFAFAIVLLAFFSAMPFAVSKIIEISGIHSIADSISTYIYPVSILVIFLLLTLWALCAYSSLSLGEKAWYTGRSLKKQNCDKRLFFWFKPKYSFKALKFSIALFAVKLFWSMVTLLPSIIILLTVFYLAYSGGIEFMLFLSLTVGGFMLAVAGLIFRFIILQRYFLAPFLISSNPRLGAVQAIKQSKNLLDGYIFRIVRFKLKFLPQFASYIFIIPFFLLYPHYKQSCSLIAKSVCL